MLIKIILQIYISISFCTFAASRVVTLKHNNEGHGNTTSPNFQAIRIAV